MLDVATIPIDKPNIWIEEPVKSNVPFDEPARFVLHMSNESDYSEQATLNFKYYLDSRSNPNGATVAVDGKVINSTSEDVSFYPVIDPVTLVTTSWREYHLHTSILYVTDEVVSFLLVDDADYRITRLGFRLFVGINLHLHVCAAARRELIISHGEILRFSFS